MAPWWSSNPSILNSNSSLESIGVGREQQRSRQVQRQQGPLPRQIQRVQQQGPPPRQDQPVQPQQLQQGPPPQQVQQVQQRPSSSAAVAVAVVADEHAEVAVVAHGNSSSGQQCSNDEDDVDGAELAARSMLGIFGNVVQQQQHHQIHPESYEEAKRLLIFAGLLFLLMSTFVLIKFQVAIDDVFRWSPAVWLIGVVICALLMNLSVQIRRFVQRIKANRRLRERQNLLFSLNLSGSFSDLSPSRLHEHVCWRHRQRFYSVDVLPRYEQIHRCALASPPAFVVCAADQRRQHRHHHKEAPPKYKPMVDTTTNEQSRSSSEEDLSPPRYEDCQHEEDGGINNG